MRVRLNTIRISKYIVAFLITVMVLLANIVYAIPQRQDPEMPTTDNVVIDEGELLEVLRELDNELNDPVIDSYVSAIEGALESGDYDAANVSLNQLREYINEEYVASDERFDKNITRALAIVSSTENITSQGVEINVYELLEEYAELVNDEELESIIREFRENPSELDSGEYSLLLKTINKLIGNETYNTALRELIEEPEANLLSEITGFKPKFSLPKPVFDKPPVVLQANIPVVPIPSSPLLVILELPVDLNILSIALLSIIVLYLLLRYKPQILGYIGPEARRVIARTIVGITDIIERIEDPVIALYGKTLRYLSLVGYRKRCSETPREFLGKLREEEYGSVLEKLTIAYEERVYGYKDIDEERIKHLAELVDEMISGRKHG